MEYRTLGRTGVKVSPLCLGAMMFGAWGNPDHDESIRIIHRALDAGINFVDTADVYAPGESEEIVGKALAGGRRDERRARDQVPRPDGRRPEPAGATRAAGSCRRSRTACAGSAPTGSTSTRCTGPTRRPTSTRRSARSPTSSAPGKIRYLGSSTFPRHEIVEAQWVGGAARPRAVRLRAAALLAARPRDRGRRAARLRAVRHGRDPLEPARRRLADAAATARAGAADLGSTGPSGSRSASTCRCPANQRKLDAAEQLAQLAEEAGLTLVHLALAFVLEHPAVTAAIIGPRTMEQLESQLGAADVQLDARLLDRIDEIVPPGTNCQPRRRRLAAPRARGPVAAPPLGHRIEIRG